MNVGGGRSSPGSATQPSSTLSYSRSSARWLSDPGPVHAYLVAVEGRSIDGIRCKTMEQVLFHIHAHLAIFAAGRPRRVPHGIGARITFRSLHRCP